MTAIAVFGRDVAVPAIADVRLAAADGPIGTGKSSRPPVLSDRGISPRSCHPPMDNRRAVQNDHRLGGRFSYEGQMARGWESEWRVLVHRLHASSG
jgi:hypothetical protein